MKFRSILSLLLSGALLAGCGASDPPAGPAESDLPEISVPPAEEPLTANGIAGRLLALESAGRPEENVILSPLSIEMALAMTANGAGGAAEEALTGLFGRTAEELNAVLGGDRPGDDTLFIANSMWYNQELAGEMDEAFRSLLSDVYGAREGSFRPGSAASAREINAWVSQATRGRINSIVEQSDLTRDTLALLVNALYFDGRWTDPFTGSQVRQGQFTSAGGGLSETEFMSGQVNDYFETGQAVGFAKAYENGYEFVAVLPREEESPDLFALDLDAFLDSRTGAYDVAVKIPKFEAEYSASLKRTLKGLGLEALFEDGALNGMLKEDSGLSAQVSDVIHKTYMRMYEEGTEAAAVTGVIVDAASAPAEPRKVKEVFLDRPFAFLILDRTTGQAVFCGVINEI